MVMGDGEIWVLCICTGIACGGVGVLVDGDFGISV